MAGAHAAKAMGISRQCPTDGWPAGTQRDAERDRLGELVHVEVKRDGPDPSTVAGGGHGDARRDPGRPGRTPISATTMSTRALTTTADWPTRRSVQTNKETARQDSSSEQPNTLPATRSERSNRS